MENDFVGMKELYDVNIRLNEQIKIGNRQFDINETILSFKQAEIAQINENKSHRHALGGFHNQMLVDWETDKEMTFAISHGILSPTTWAALTNSKLSSMTSKSVPFKEELDVIESSTNDVWFVNLKFKPNHVDKMGLQPNPDNAPLPMGRKDWLPLKPLPPQPDRFIFCYDMETGSRIMNFEVNGNQVVFKAEHRKVMVDYTFDYEDRCVELNIGDRLLDGFLNLTGKMTVKDYITGEPKTAILEIPKIKISSSLGINLGMGAGSAAVSDFYFIGYPKGGGDRTKDRSICKMTFLDTELLGEYV